MKLTQGEIDHMIHASRQAEEGPTQFARRIEGEVRERCAALCDSETIIQCGEFGAGWVQGAKACADLIREA